jgi:ubiquinone/menaquinone biosynthesis C-methylase UbiE
MKLNWAERWVVNNPLRMAVQKVEIGLFKKMGVIKEDASVLECGCGRGAGARLILRTFRPSSIHATDLDVKMVEQARTYLSEKELRRIRLYVGDVQSIPFNDASFDLVFSFGILHHVIDWRSSLTEIARVLKKGGFYIFEELYPSLYQNVITRRILLHPEEDRFCSDDLKDGLERAGLLLVNSLELRHLGILAMAQKLI